MLHPIQAACGGRQVNLRQFLRESCGHGAAFGLCSGQIAESVRWLGAYLHAVSILVQIPGGAAYEPMLEDRVDFCEAIWTRERGPALTMLAEVLRRLGAERLMEQVPNEGASKDSRVGDQASAKSQRRMSKVESCNGNGARSAHHSWPLKNRSGHATIDESVQQRLDGLTPKELVHVAVDCLDRLFIAPVMPGYERYHENVMRQTAGVK